MHEITLNTLMKITDMFRLKSKSKSNNTQFNDNSPDDSVYNNNLYKNKCLNPYDTKDGIPYQEV